MKILVDEITQSANDVTFTERIDDLNEIYKEGQVRDYGFPRSLDVDLVYYRSGQDIFFQGSFAGIFEGTCSRCLKSYSFEMDQDFDFVLTPRPSTPAAKARELSREDLGLSFYSTEEINLTPLIKEQVLLALPTRPLCREGCRGLCGGCGANLNDESCACSAAAGDPRMALFRALKLGH